MAALGQCSNEICVKRVCDALVLSSPVEPNRGGVHSAHDAADDWPNELVCLTMHLFDP